MQLQKGNEPMKLSLEQSVTSHLQLVGQCHHISDGVTNLVGQCHHISDGVLIWWDNATTSVMALLNLVGQCHHISNGVTHPPYLCAM